MWTGKIVASASGLDGSDHFCGANLLAQIWGKLKFLKLCINRCVDIWDMEQNAGSIVDID